MIERKLEEKLESMDSLLYLRKRLLNNRFDFTDENIAILKKMNALLRTSSLTLVDKINHIRKETMEKMKTYGVIEDFGIEEFIQVNVDKYSYADPIEILEIIDAV